MSANTTSAGSISSSINAVLRPSVHSILIGHTFLTLLLPLLIALFYFSTPQSRRRPIFILNVITIILAFFTGIMVDALAVHSMLSMQQPWPPGVNIAIGIIGSFQSMLVDLILLLRLISVHPLSHLGPKRFAMLIALPVLLKVARLTNMFIFIKVLADAARGPLGPEKIAIVWATKPYLKIEWSAQMVDNAYASLAFLWSIRDRGNRQGVTSDIHPNRVTFSQRLRTLSRIALSNFVIPALFSIAQLIVVYRNVNVLVVNEIVLVNFMLAVIGVVFATVWTGKANRQEAEIDLWDGSSRVDCDPEKRPNHRAFAFPGLGSWRVASVPPTVTFGSSKHTAPTENARVVTLDRTGSEDRNDRAVDRVGSPSASAGSLDEKADREVVAKPGY